MALSDEEKKVILQNAKSFFINRIIPSHLNGIRKASHLSEYDYNPFLLKYLASCINDGDEYKSLAKALFYPRVLGTSINTIFGCRLQEFIATVLPRSEGTLVPGMDIQFEDALDGRVKYCQVKAGPNTINNDDVTTIRNHFQSAIRLATQNRTEVNVNDFVVGILYGDTMSHNYRQIAEIYPVHTGRVFWYHLTGELNFYDQMCNVFKVAASEAKVKDEMQRAIDSLTNEIKANYTGNNH